MLQHVRTLGRFQRLNNVMPAAAQQWRSMGFGSNMSDNDPEVMEKEKQRHLQGKSVSHIKEHKGWSEKLASDAEAMVKAERTPDKSVDELQKETIERLEEQSKCDAEDVSGTVSEPRSGALGNA